MAGLGNAMAGEVSSRAEGVVGKADRPKMSDMKVSRIEIEPSDNGGFTAQCFYDTKSKKVVDGPGHYVRPTKHVYTDAAEMMSDIAKKLGVAGSDEGGGEGADGADTESANG